MSFLDPQAEAQAVTDAVITQLKTMFPYEGRKHNLVMTGIRVGDSGDAGDIRGQKQAKLKGRTWSAPLFADLELQTKDGKVVDSVKNQKLLGLPRMTNLLSYIVDGAETQISHQWHLKAGAYARVKENGELTTQFNVSGAPGFSVDFNPDTRKYTLGMAKSNVPLYSILRGVYGVSDEVMEKKWGRAVLDANRTVGDERHVAKLYKAIFDKLPEDRAEAVTGIRENFTNSKMYGDTNELTLGAPISEVSDDALLRASSRLLNISRGDDQQDPRDALHFKDLWGIENYLPKRLSDMSSSIRRKIRNNLDRKETVGEIVHRDIFDAPIKSFFRLSLAELSHQVNPVAMLTDQRKTTIMGPMGGVQNEYAISIDDRLVDQSHLGYLDAIPSPEGSMTGITTFLPVGATKRGLQVFTKMYSPKTGKMEDVSPEKAYHYNVAFPDQYTWENGKPVPTGKLVKVNGKKNDFDEVLPGQVDYILPSAQALMTVSTNMVPFVQNDMGLRVNYGAKQITQAISLVNREVPLVQVHTGAKDQKLTWERVVGKHFSSSSPIDGVVASVGDDFIRVRGSDKKTHEVPLYHDYPLNDGKSSLNSEAVVKAGDRVDKGQLLADTNFTKGGVLAYGTNARIAYMPWKDALTFEDGIVVSDAFAKRMTSAHLMQERLYADKNYLMDKKKYRGFYPDRLTDEQSKKLDDTGVIMVGQQVSPGDPLVVALKKGDPSKEQLILKGLHKSIVKPYADASLIWENDHPGVVAEVVRNGREVLVHVKMEAPLVEADKLAGRHGNKGVVSRVLPVGDMPVDKDGKPVDIVFNPTGVGARVNAGQLYETLLGKVAAANGSTFTVTNFASDPEKRVSQVDGHWRTVKTETGSKEVWIAPHERSYYHLVKRELARAGISDRERLFDPKTGVEYKSAEGTPGVLTGYQYFLKLEHTAAKKASARGQGAGFDYDANMAPKGGGDSGGQSIGGLGLYALLGHGDATAILREANTIKSDRSNEEWWAAFQAGQPTPLPKVPFAYEKFVSYLNALGVDVEKKGSDLQLIPMTDKDILAQSRGEVVLNRLVRAKDLKPEKGGIFDEDLTGGTGGSGWSHAKLPEPVPNPMFEKAIAALTGLTLKEFNGLVGGTTGTDSAGKLVPAEEAVLQGGVALESILKKINVKEDLARTLQEVKTAKRTELDKLVKKAKYLRSLDRLGVRPEDVYMVHNLPVIPPKFRPMSVLEGGDLNVDDLNGMYQQIGILVEQLKTFPDKLPPELKNELRASAYDALASLAGLGGSMNEGKTAKKGILDIIAGPSPKDGFFHRALLTRKQDLSMRGVIVPGGNVTLDEIGLPRDAAMVVFTPFVVRDLVRLGYTPNAARVEVDNKSHVAETSLDNVVKNHPVLVKRDPALHKFSIMAFLPKLIGGKSIRLHPLATGGYNADHDGDTMSVYVPVTEEAIAQARKMLPSENLFNTASGMVMNQPTLEAQVGLFALTSWGSDKGKKFSSTEALLHSAKEKQLPYGEVVSLNGKKTTAGRALLDSVLPKGMQGGPLLTEASSVLNKSGLQSLMQEIAKKHPSEFATSIDAIKDIAFGYAHSSGLTLTMDDLEPLSAIRDRAFVKADATVSAAMKRGLSKKELDKVRVAAYGQASKEMTAESKPLLDKKGNTLFRMSQSGSKPSWDQIRQMIISPVQLTDGRGNTIPIPVKHSYAEGLDFAEYWTAAHGARKGIIDKTIEVAEPGALAKVISAAVINMVITKDDCGTVQGISLDSSSSDALDRYTAQPVKLNKGVLPAGSMMTPEVQASLKASGVGKILVRSPLRCTVKEGLCAHCTGLAPNGRPFKLRENVGIMSGQSVGERSVQLAMKAFHAGGVAGGKGGVTGLDRLRQVLMVPETLAGSATLSKTDGVVQSVAKDPAGGWRVTVGDESHYVPNDRGEPTVAKGATIRKGQVLSGGPMNPRELLGLTNIETVQNYLTSAMEDTYAGEGLKRRNFEVVAKAMTNLATVDSSGDHPDYLRGDLVPLSIATSWNKENQGKESVKMTPVLKGLNVIPFTGTEDWMARMNFQRLKETLQEGAMRGWRSSIHSTHPTAGLAYATEFGKPGKDAPWTY